MTQRAARVTANEGESDDLATACQLALLRSRGRGGRLPVVEVRLMMRDMGRVETRPGLGCSGNFAQLFFSPGASTASKLE
jgi:hypothetical protein